jgi:hypothetical protein
LVALIFVILRNIKKFAGIRGLFKVFGNLDGKRDYLLKIEE